MITSDSATANQARSDTITVAVANAMGTAWSARWAMMACAVAFSGLALILTLRSPRQYASTFTFYPDVRGTGASQLSTIAAQFGIQQAAGDGSLTSGFYSDLATSRATLEHVFEGELSVATPAGPTTASIDIGQALALKDSAPNQRLEHAVAWLRDHTVADVSAKTNVVRITVRAPTPVLARRFADAILAALIDYGTIRRMSRARVEREFAESRLAAVTVELRQAEDSLREFLSRNRDYSHDPALKFEESRLERTDATKATVVTGLSQSYEQARIEEVRDTPALSVLDPPETPLRPDNRSLGMKLLAAIVAGAFVGMLSTVVKKAFDQILYARRALARRVLEG